MNLYTVSVRLMTYNHAAYIKEAMDGVIMQKTNFLVEVVVGDDFSTDDTLEMVKRYQDTENIHIKILQRKVGDQYWKNRQQKGRLYNFVNILQNCSGKYIALLDGDDYWTDPLKLQKQVDFLEENPAFSICLHNGKIYEEDKRIFRDFDTPSRYIIDGKELNINYIARCRGVLAPTASFMYRTSIMDDYFYDYLISAIIGDFSVIILSIICGKIGMIQEQMCVYRTSLNNSSWTATSQSFDYKLNFAKTKELMWQKFNQHTKGKYSNLIKQAVGTQYSSFINGIGRLTSKKKQFQMLWQFRNKLMLNDFLYTIPRIVFRKNKFW